VEACGVCHRDVAGIHNLLGYRADSQDGGYAVQVTARASGLVALPDDLPATELAPLMCAGLTVHHALVRAPARAGVHGISQLGAVAKLTEIAKPTLIFQGDNDIMIPTRASHTLAGLTPGAELVVDPDASHGSIFQYADETAHRTIAFFDA
jgi:D-arabinose 1-dehydrogenase-like Zn-dependent alcohol dehydrogenase